MTSAPLASHVSAVLGSWHDWKVPAVQVLQPVVGSQPSAHVVGSNLLPSAAQTSAVLVSLHDLNSPAVQPIETQVPGSPVSDPSTSQIGKFGSMHVPSAHVAAGLGFVQPAASARPTTHTRHEFIGRRYQRIRLNMGTVSTAPRLGCVESDVAYFVPTIPAVSWAAVTTELAVMKLASLVFTRIRPIPPPPAPAK